MRKNKSTDFIRSAMACLLPGCLFLSGCHGAAPHSLGTAIAESPVVAVQALAARTPHSPVVVEGEMIEKCPVAGCWFVLKDKTGVVRVDTKAAGFVVTEVPLHTRLTVAGTLTPGTQPGMAATGIRY
jgi:uncharacterized protein YdeI (BOF family)